MEWQSVIKSSGTFSSPRTVDLNGDGVKDIVLGAGGRREWEASEKGVIAFNGADGTILWKRGCRNQVIGSPVFFDITNEGVPDIFIGGRSAQFMALDGSNGELIWEFQPTNDQVDYESDTTILNFFNPQFLSDQDEDDIPDLLISYGGYVKAKPNEHNRPVGYLMIFSTKTGEVLAKAPVPDGKETYMSPVILQRNGKEYVLFGTGGETITGNFYITPVADIKDNKITLHDTLISGRQKGFIAPPVIVDLNEDDVQDIVINAYEGKIIAIDGIGFKSLWEVNLGNGFESHSQPAIGNFTGDSSPDLFFNYGKGAWPEITGSLQIVIDGSNGEYSVVDSVGYIQYASPISVMQPQKPYELILLPINDLLPTNYSIESGKPPFAYQNQLYLFDPVGKTKELILSNPGTNTGSTVLIEDLDSDGNNEMIYVYNLNPFDAFEHNGFSVSCRTVSMVANGWNQYMGADGLGFFQDF